MKRNIRQEDKHKYIEVYETYSSSKGRNNPCHNPDLFVAATFRQVSLNRTNKRVS